jgi:hypothetical protein
MDLQYHLLQLGILYNEQSQCLSHHYRQHLDNLGLVLPRHHRLRLYLLFLMLLKLGLLLRHQYLNRQHRLFHNMLHRHRRLRMLQKNLKLKMQNLHHQHHLFR